MSSAVHDAEEGGLLIPVDAPAVRQRFARARQGGLRAKEAADSLGLPEGAAIAAHAGQHEGSLQAVPLDRKSTRLNSSHSQISYAVFCLKKKNKKTAHLDINGSRTIRSPFENVRRRGARQCTCYETLWTTFR